MKKLEGLMLLHLLVHSALYSLGLLLEVLVLFARLPLGGEYDDHREGLEHQPLRESNSMIH